MVLIVDNCVDPTFSFSDHLRRTFCYLVFSSIVRAGNWIEIISRIFIRSGVHIYRKLVWKFDTLSMFASVCWLYFIKSTYMDYRIIGIGSSYLQFLPYAKI